LERGGDEKSPETTEEVRKETKKGGKRQTEFSIH